MIGMQCFELNWYVQHHIQLTFPDYMEYIMQHFKRQQKFDVEYSQYNLLQHDNFLNTSQSRRRDYKYPWSRFVSVFFCANTAIVDILVLDELQPSDIISASILRVSIKIPWPLIDRAFLQAVVPPYSTILTSHPKYLINCLEASEKQTINVYQFKNHAIVVHYLNLFIAVIIISSFHILRQYTHTALIILIQNLYKDITEARSRYQMELHSNITYTVILENLILDLFWPCYREMGVIEGPKFNLTLCLAQQNLVLETATKPTDSVIRSL